MSPSTNARGKSEGNQDTIEEETKETQRDNANGVKEDKVDNNDDEEEDDDDDDDDDDDE